ncbi:hypothetical protein DYB35_009191 [Aphanomyces astaci]|uniref:HPP transmembrane region domain-containing protein n=1 Tax=Aphanomyces astaci TaxID=112090 RepID=A0A3R6ZXG1_APHAT|nr:hypothetical protein DYB35_009191 [Aphanomyces astaci]
MNYTAARDDASHNLHEEEEAGLFRGYVQRTQGNETTPEICPALPMLAILPANRTVSNYTREAYAAKAKVILWSFIASFSGIAILAAIQFTLHAEYSSGVQNCIVGNTLSAFVGVVVADVFQHVAPGDEWKWLSCALAISISLVAMQLTDTVNPPAKRRMVQHMTTGDPPAPPSMPADDGADVGFQRVSDTAPSKGPLLMGTYALKFCGVESMPANPEVNAAHRRLAIDPTHRNAIWDSHRRRHRMIILFWSFVSSFCGIGVLAAIQYSVQATYGSGVKVTSIIGSFGATAILTFGAIQSPLAQPRNVVLGNTLSAIVGVSISQLFLHVAPGDGWKWLSCALAVSLSLVVMQVTDTVHPPGGATALIAVISGPDIQELGYLYVVMPVFTGSCILVLVRNQYNKHSSFAQL